MRVRTDVGALVAGAILAAVLSLVAVGDGSPPRAPAGPRVTVSQMQRDDSLPVFHRVPQGGEPRVQQEIAPPVVPDPPPAPKAAAPPPADAKPPFKLDAYVFQGLRGGLTYIALFFLLHLGLRKGRVGGRWPYVGIGAVSALASVASQTPLLVWPRLAADGRLSEYLGIVAVFGAIMGFLYCWRAGLEAEGDDPALLDKTLKGVAGEPAPDDLAGVSSAISEDGSLVDTGQTEYFSGPLQVRTSLPVMFVAALVSSGFYGLAHMLFGIAGEMDMRLKPGLQQPIHDALGLAVQSQLHTIVIMGMMAPVPFTIVILLGHLILRAMDRTSYKAYVVAGACAPFLLVLVLGPVLGALMGLAAIVPLVISMCVYRSMAGLEPKAVKEDIMVRDRRNLVGANHVRRQFGRVVKS
ncbi:MAG: hypothetical protein JWQ29_193 [Phenylobacterium sp.]|nr:hypothetical protein [Phenylobacterium sp.]